MGFTLLQLMMGIVVVAILGALALPSYRDYVIRSRVAEAFEFADAARNEVILKRTEGGIPALASNYRLNISSRPGHMDGLQWVFLGKPDAKGEAPLGVLIPSLNIPELGKRDAFALEYQASGAWRCIPASALVDRASFSTNDGLEEKYLPPQCRGGSKPLATLRCPHGEAIQTTDQNGKTQFTCPPMAIPTLKPALQPTPQPMVAPVRAPMATPGLRPLLQCKPGYDCNHEDRNSNCPTGQTFFAGGDFRGRDVFNPFNSASQAEARNKQDFLSDAWQGTNPNVQNTGKPTIRWSSLQVNAGCVAKCADGFVFDPTNPSRCNVKPQPSYWCPMGAFDCEKNTNPIRALTLCPNSAPYPANHIHNYGGGFALSRSCLTPKEAFEAAKWNKAHPECANYDSSKPTQADFYCTYACTGPLCNADHVPKATLTWRDGKTEADLPDQLDKP